MPFTSFAENETQPDGSSPTVWFAFDESRPLAFFAGLWTSWTSVRKVKEGKITTDLFGFLTTAPNAEVRAVHSQAMPAILTEPAEWAIWLSAPWSEARALQRPLPDGVINRKIANTAIGRDVTEALATFDLPVLGASLCQRVVYAESAAQGLAVWESDANGPAARELETLTSETLHTLARQAA